MLNIRDLEKRWFKHKLKSYSPYLIIILSLCIFFIVIFTFIDFKKEYERIFETYITKVKTLIPAKEEKVEEKVTLVSTPMEKSFEQKVMNAENSLKLSPSLGFLYKLQHSTLPHQNHKQSIKKKTQTIQNIPNEEIIEEVQNLQVDNALELKEEEIKKVTIKRRNITEDIQHIIKRFKKNNNPTLSLFIAKKYYEIGDYHKAYNYAFITNQINRNIEDSWIVFSKSLVKLNKKEMAVNTLKEYIANSHSSSAQILLDEITSGKFK